ncbi:hypothetical protein ACHAWO_013512 [Cyclotella atomus]|uniref:Lipoyl-binding domain-containing protein n=1 Tax=Cyclotella atomus TaxID=382360 RepID=A0ABD3PDB7_9STRA
MLSNIRSISRPLQRAISQNNRQAIQRSNNGSCSIYNHDITSTSLSSTPTARSFFTTPTNPEKLTIKVPTMGDSITEGTIVEWVAPVGSSVSEGDVVCLIETDKVTVDIKADVDGVVVQHLGEVEGVVEVGGALYVLDTDLSAASAVDAGVVMEEKEASPAAAAVSMEAPTPPSSSPSTRVPSIRFLGKQGWEALRKGGSTSSQSSSSSGTTIVSNPKPQQPTSITYQPYMHMYGRPTITDEEMEALMLGGAEEAPLMKKEKMGAVSFYGGKIVTAGPRGVWLAEEGM